MATIYCPACGHENDIAARFCENCGRSLADVAAMRATAEAPGARSRPKREREQNASGAGGTWTGPDPTGMPAGDDRLLDDEGQPLVDSMPVGEPLSDDPNAERVLWRGRPSKLWSPRMAITNRYRLTDQRLRWEYGFVAKRVEEVDLFRINDVAVKQAAFERILGFGDITVFMTDSSSPQKILHNVPDPETIKDLIRNAVRRERQRRRVMIREDMYGHQDEGL